MLGIFDACCIVLGVQFVWAQVVAKMDPQLHRVQVASQGCKLAFLDAGSVVLVKQVFWCEVWHLLPCGIGGFENSDARAGVAQMVEHGLVIAPAERFGICVHSVGQLSFVRRNALGRGFRSQVDNDSLLVR